MNEQALRQLLVNADAAAGTPAILSSDLAATVVRRLRRKRRAQVAGVSVVLCAMLAVVPLIRKAPTLLEQHDQLAQARAELSLMRVQANSQAATVNRLMAYQRSVDIRTKATRKLDRGQPLERLQQQREGAARVLTQDGEYRRVIELFPETHWAQVARQRLQT
jgi:hypothetical protein